MSVFLGYHRGRKMWWDLRACSRIWHSNGLESLHLQPKWRSCDLDFCYERFWADFQAKLSQRYHRTVTSGCTSPMILRSLTCSTVLEFLRYTFILDDYKILRHTRIWCNVYCLTYFYFFSQASSSSIRIMHFLRVIPEQHVSVCSNFLSEHHPNGCSTTRYSKLWHEMLVG